MSLSEAKQHLRVEISDDDALISALILAAADAAEAETKLAICEQDFEMRAAGFPCGDEPIALPVPPLLWVNSIAYTDTNGDPQTLDVAGADFITSPGSEREPGSIRPKWGDYWPVALYAQDSVIINFTAGFPSSASPAGADGVPAAIKQAVLLLVGHLYENREAVNIGNIGTEVPMGFKALLDGFRAYI